MYNKIKVAGIIVGAVAVIAAGACLLRRRRMKKQQEAACDGCEMCNECECNGKYADACFVQGECLVEDVEPLKVEDFENTEF